MTVRTLIGALANPATPRAQPTSTARTALAAGTASTAFAASTAGRIEWNR